MGDSSVRSVIQKRLDEFCERRTEYDAVIYNCWTGALRWVLEQIDSEGG